MLHTVYQSCRVSADESDSLCISCPINSWSTLKALGQPSSEEEEEVTHRRPGMWIFIMLHYFFSIFQSSETFVLSICSLYLWKQLWPFLLQRLCAPGLLTTPQTLMKRIFQNMSQWSAGGPIRICSQICIVSNNATTVLCLPSTFSSGDWLRPPTEGDGPFFCLMSFLYHIWRTTAESFQNSLEPCRNSSYKAAMALSLKDSMAQMVSTLKKWLVPLGNDSASILLAWA